MVTARRLIGLILALLVLLPWYSLLDIPAADMGRRGSVDGAELTRSLLFLGSLILLTLAFVASKRIDAERFDSWMSAAAARIMAIPPLAFVGAMAAIAAIITALFSLLVLDGKPNLIDAMSQLLHARYFAAGRLAGPADEWNAFWQVQNSLVTPGGWVSQYPPGFVALLAAGFRLGSVHLIPPLLVGATVWFTGLAAHRLLADDQPVARLGTAMLALSPFFIGLAGAFMNHVFAAAFTSAAVYFAIRSALSLSWRWGLATGIALGCVATVRPLAAFVAGIVVLLTWFLLRPAVIPVARAAGTVAAAAFGAIPFVAALGAYNARFFGSPLRFSYMASQGPTINLGFHLETTGLYYGPRDAIGYTAADLVTLSLYLLESPIPAVLVVALFLVFVPRLSAGQKVIAAWALIPVAANFFYWHHGMFMGPRMLNEAAPAWALLTAGAAVGLVRLVPRDLDWAGYAPRAAIGLAFVGAWAVGLLYLGPSRLLSYGGPFMESSRVEAPRTERPSLVFVHGAWSGRLAMRLVAGGMRLDSLETAMRQNATCDLQRYTDWYTSRASSGAAAPAPLLDFEAGARPPVPRAREAGGDFRAHPGVPLSPQCYREATSDTLGVTDVTPLLWQGDLPGLDGAGAMLVRDLGPEANARLIGRYPQREPFVYMRLHPDSAPRLLPYNQGIAILWR